MLGMLESEIGVHDETFKVGKDSSLGAGDMMGDDGF